jgi:hypothetical protein
MVRTSFPRGNTADANHTAAAAIRTFQISEHKRILSEESKSCADVMESINLRFSGTGPGRLDFFSSLAFFPNQLTFPPQDDF